MCLLIVADLFPPPRMKQCGEKKDTDLSCQCRNKQCSPNIIAMKQIYVRVKALFKATGHDVVVKMATSFYF